MNISYFVLDVHFIQDASSKLHLKQEKKNLKQRGFKNKHTMLNPVITIITF